MSLPSHFHNEAHLEASSSVGTAEGVNDEELLVAEFSGGDLLEFSPSSLADGLVVVLVFLGSPPYSVLAGFVHHEELVLGRTAGVDAGHYVHSVQLGVLAYFEAFEAGFGFLFEEYFVGGVVYDFLYAGDAVLG